MDNWVSRAFIDILDLPVLAKWTQSEETDGPVRPAGQDHIVRDVNTADRLLVGLQHMGQFCRVINVGITACTNQPILTPVLLSSPCSRWTVILVPAVAVTVGPRRARLHTGRWPTARLKQGYTADEVSTSSQGDQRNYLAEHL